MASFLRAQHWPDDSRIAILVKNSAGWIMADLAIWMAGYVSVPIYPVLTASSVKQIVAHSGALACFIGKLDNTAPLDGIPGKLRWDR
jgi:long-chain acyl-CoA synthetase